MRDPRKALPVTWSVVVALLAFSSLGTFFAGSSAAVEQTLTFGPVADTFVRSDRPTKNLGSAASFVVDNSPVKHGLLRFSVSGIGASVVAAAKLRLYNVDKSSKGGDFYRVADNTWEEKTVTWNTAPAADPTPVASLGAVAANTWYEVNLTSLVTGDGTYSVKITSTSADGVAYTSKEGAAGFGPQLVVTLAAPLDTIPPTASVSSPSSGDTVSGTVSVEAQASDDVGVTTVELHVDGALQGVATTSPYLFSWDTLASANGDHDLTAVAFDAAGNSAISDTVTVAVGNTPDASPPTAPSGLTATASGSTRVDLSWTASTDDVAVDHYAVFRDVVQIGTSTTASYADTTVSSGTTYSYSVTAYDPTGNPSAPSETVSVTTPQTTTTFAFAAAGDHGANSRTAASLAALDASGVSFYLALGDMDYDQTASDGAWCDYVKTRLPTLGPTFPFELVSGNHEEQGGSNGYILNHAACLPDRLDSTLSPTNQYAAEYFFDYPSGAPLVRVVMIAADLLVENVAYDYKRGTARYDWLAGVIDDARASGIPWVVVGMHKNCITAGRKGCEIGADLMNLLVEKRVDLVLQGHDHNYQRSKQLSLNTSTCPAVPVGAYDPDCVVDDGTDDVYPKGTGTLFVIDGTFGMGLYPVSPNDPEAPYFARSDATSWGFTEYTVTADRIEARFLNSSGTFTETFTILNGAPPSADINPPSAPTGLSGIASSNTRVDLSWIASTDDVAVDHYAVLRGGLQIGTSTAPSYTDTTADSGSTYAYSVRAYDPAGNPSAPSETISVTTPGPVTLTFGAAADALVRSDQPDSNFGTLARVTVDGSPVEQALLKFTVSGIGTGTVAGAKLRLYNVNSSSMGGTFYRVADSSWLESTVTWNTAPAADATPIASLGAVATGTWYEVDVTPLITGDGTYSIRMSSTSGDGADYTSKEGTAGFRPQLVITLQP